MAGVTRAKLRGGAILAALRNGRVVDLQVDLNAPCVRVPQGWSHLRIGLGAGQCLKVSPLGLHATLKRQNIMHVVRVPWHAIVSWKAVKNV